MTEGYPAQWQQDVQVDDVVAPHADGRHEATIAEPVGRSFDDAASTGDDGAQGKAGAVKEQAAAVGQGAAEAGVQVASVAKDQASSVVAEAGSQAKDLLGQARSELTEQAGSQQRRLVETLRSLGSELESMGHHSEEPGLATDLVKQASGRAHDAASWLDGREPGSLFSELQGFARQRPAAFLALAAGAGLVVGRLGRGVKDAAGDDKPSAPSAPSASSAPSAPTASSASTAPSGLIEAAPVSGSGYAATTYVDTTPVAGGGFGSVGEARPFASSQDADYPYDGGITR